MVQTIYLPKMDAEYEANESKGRNHKYYSQRFSAENLYAKGRYRQAINKYLSIYYEEHPSTYYVELLLTSYRKLYKQLLAKKMYKKAFLTLEEMIRYCPNITKHDIKHFNSTLLILKQKGLYLDIPPLSEEICQDFYILDGTIRNFDDFWETEANKQEYHFVEMPLHLYGSDEIQSTKTTTSSGYIAVNTDTVLKLSSGGEIQIAYKIPKWEELYLPILRIERRGDIVHIQHQHGLYIVKNDEFLSFIEADKYRYFTHAFSILPNLSEAPIQKLKFKPHHGNIYWFPNGFFWKSDCHLIVYTDDGHVMGDLVFYHEIKKIWYYRNLLLIETKNHKQHLFELTV